MKFPGTKFTTLLMVFALLMLSACGQQNTEPVVNEASTPPLPKLLDLGAEKCIPCKQMAPILADLMESYSGEFETVFVDVWQPENKAEADRHDIRSIPTQIFFDATGKELWRHEGYISKEDILMKWQELGFTFEQAG
ncbi:thioredoxin family protein [Kiritimatiellota bacterium B12222]|nr:thioredoxin family protein [Kiritimatiellota bacterium B12222]